MEQIDREGVADPVFNYGDLKKLVIYCHELISSAKNRMYSAIIDDRLSFDTMLNHSDLITTLESAKSIFERCMRQGIQDCLSNAYDSSNNLFLEGPFSEWCLSDNNMTREAVEAYIDYIKLVNYHILCETGYDIFSCFLPDYVKTRNMTKIDEMFVAIYYKLCRETNFFPAYVRTHSTYVRTPLTYYLTNYMPKIDEFFERIGKKPIWTRPCRNINIEDYYMQRHDINKGFVAIRKYHRFIESYCLKPNNT